MQRRSIRFMAFREVLEARRVLSTVAVVAVGPVLVAEIPPTGTPLVSPDQAGNDPLSPAEIADMLNAGPDQIDAGQASDAPTPAAPLPLLPGQPAWGDPLGVDTDPDLPTVPWPGFFGSEVNPDGPSYTPPAVAPLPPGMPGNSNSDAIDRTIEESGGALHVMFALDYPAPEDYPS